MSVLWKAAAPPPVGRRKICCRFGYAKGPPAHDQGQGPWERNRRTDDPAVQEGVREGRAHEGHQARRLLREAQQKAPPPFPRQAPDEAGGTRLILDSGLRTLVWVGGL